MSTVSIFFVFLCFYVSFFSSKKEKKEKKVSPPIEPSKELKTIKFGGHAHVWHLILVHSSVIFGAGGGSCSF